MERLPQHVAIILDGNRRWASENGMSKLLGHSEGAKTLETITKAAAKLGIRYLTVYALSTENLKKRSEDEVNHLFDILEKISNYEESFEKHGIQFNIIGDISKLPQKVQENILAFKEKTQHNTTLTVTVALNYGGRDEIIRAAQKLAAAHTPITEESFANALDTTGLPDVELVIRTGGHKRLSNFLPWQSTYAELYFTDTKWPQFTETELKCALDWFSQQERNGGK
jgi:undecaprenyl diphosphate synthase